MWAGKLITNFNPTPPNSLFFVPAPRKDCKTNIDAGHRQPKYEAVGILSFEILVYILFASRYPTSPSEGSFLYDCLKEGLQIKEKLERFELKGGKIKGLGLPKAFG